MKQFLITVAGVLVGLILFLVVVPILLIGSIAGSADKAPVVASNSVLSLDLREDLRDQPSTSPFGLDGVSVVEVVRRLEAAGSDKRVDGLFIRANTSGMSAAHADEIRDAIAAFRKSGKFVVAHMQNDTLSTSMAGYAAIAGADEIWAQPNEHILPLGVTIEGAFFGGALEKFKARAEFEKREDYKSAPEQFTQRRYTPAAREDLEKILNGWVDRFYTTVSTDRKISVEQAKAIVAESPFTTERAKELKLVDQLGYPEDAERAALERAGDKSDFLDLADYRPEPPSGPVIALVTGDGAIISGPSEPSFFGGEDVMNSDRIAEAIDDAAKDEEVKAILFRVNSPGGSVSASDQILAAVKRAQAGGKKVVISMGPVAASGGYWVSAAADEIVASPSTITGSIGIFGGKLVLGDTLEQYVGITTDTISAGSPLSQWFTSSRGFSNAERAAFAKTIDDGYAAFLKTVADGRGMTPDQVRAIAGGRVYTGEQAKAIGLVDHVGGLSVAIERTKALAGIKADEKVGLKIFPMARSPLEELQSAFGVSEQAAAGAAVLAGVLGDDRVAGALRAAMREEHGGVRAETTDLQVR